MNKDFSIKPALAALALTLAGCSGEADSDAGTGIDDRSDSTLSEVIEDADSISTVAGLLKTTGIVGALGGDANYTLFAPSNTAIDALGEQPVKVLGDKSNGAIAAAILREHMVPGALNVDAIRSAIKTNGGEVTMRTFGTGNLRFALDGETITVSEAGGNSANLTGASKFASNGAVLIIDAVLADTSHLLPAEGAAE